MNIREIAKQAGVSTATVSRVLNGNPSVNEELRDRVQRIIDAANYVPNAIARSMSHGSTSILGLILPDITNPFFPGIARGVEDAATSQGYKVILCNTDNQEDVEESYLRMLREQRVDGVILVSSRDGVEEQIQNLLAEIPVVLCDRVPESGAYSSVLTDHQKGITMAVDHLVQLGHRHIALISGPNRVSVPRERLLFFRDYLESLGLDCPADRILHGDYRFESGVNAMNRLLKDEQITAVLCGNDMMALGAMDAALNAGRQIPDDISIVGYDNIPFSNWTRPALTSVSQPTYLLGVNSFEILVDIIRGNQIRPERRLLEPTLVVRKSTARVNA